jgi:hypothetical protein
MTRIILFDSESKSGFDSNQQKEQMRIRLHSRKMASRHISDQTNNVRELKKSVSTECGEQMTIDHQKPAA